MSVRDVPTVTRTVTISDMTPAEMASIFASWFDDQQAAFFAALVEESKDWPGSQFEGQAYAIVQKLDRDGMKIVGDLAHHWNDRNAGEPR